MQKTRPNNQSLFPVFKFDLDKKLVEANRASMPLLEKWGWKLDQSLPTHVISQYPQLFHAILGQRPTELAVSMDGFQIHFCVVPFPEAGYIGMYAYSLEAESGLARSQNASFDVSQMNLIPN
jgi:hypothetical protein